MIVPTGIGASIGGFAGDALPVARLLASTADRLITHPNVMNAAMLYWPRDNILYVEGNTLNDFAKGKVLLQPLQGKRGQKIGVILDKGIEEDLRVRHIQVCDAVRASLGIDVEHVVISSHPVGISTSISSSGASWGSIDNIDTLIGSAEVLKARGCTAIAVVTRFPEDNEERMISDDLQKKEDHGNSSPAELFAAYRRGEGVDPIAGVESIISHVINQHVGLPVAHAPAFAPSSLDACVVPKACAEELGYTFLPCVLANLYRAPNIIPISDLEEQQPFRPSSLDIGLIHSTDVDAIVVPHNALGGPAVLSYLNRHSSPLTKKTKSFRVDAKGPLIIAVKENETSMRVTATDLDADQVLTVRSYAEAAGFLAAHKEGILFESLSSNVKSVSVEFL